MIHKGGRSCRRLSRSGSCRPAPQGRGALLAARRRGLTFAEATDKCLAAKLDAFKNAKRRQQWQNTLQSYAMPELG